jgi:integrase/recombinase XerC
MKNEITVSNNLISDLIADKRSENTKRAYQKDLEDFFTVTIGQPVTPELINHFLNLAKPQAFKTVWEFKSRLIGQGLKEATINRKLAAVKSLVSYAEKIGLCDWDLDDIQGEKVETYRDTSGITTEQVSNLLATTGQNSPKGKRDYAILRLLWENALRRGEIAKLNINDFFPEESALYILGKGKGTQKERITLSSKTVQAINEWLHMRNDTAPTAPLFIALDRANKGHRLTGEAIAYIVKEASRKAGITKKMSPHRIRHSSITAALEVTNGNVALVQKLSRHSKIETVMIYEDHRENQQKKVTELLSAIA